MERLHAFTAKCAFTLMMRSNFWRLHIFLRLYYAELKFAVHATDGARCSPRLRTHAQRLFVKNNFWKIIFFKIFQEY